MTDEDIESTDLWVLYTKSVDYARKNFLFENVDKNNNFYNGDQWEGLIVDGIEKVQYNFIKPIVDYKVTKITENLRTINYSADNLSSIEFRKTAKQICDLLNQRAARVWEKDQMDYKIKKVVRKAGIVSEGVIYVSYDEDAKDPLNEIINKTDIYYGNENDDDIESQPYILVKQRLSVNKVQEIARKYKVKDSDVELITGDRDYLEEAGEDAKDEINPMVTLITKFYKKDGTVWFSKATKKVVIKDDTDSGLTYYPVSHMPWSPKDGSARGESEVTHLIPNQIETNKTLMRRLLTAKNTAYPQKVINKDKISNPEAADSVGGTIYARGADVDDVRKVFNVTQPAQMSNDVHALQDELITKTRELANASDTATGQVNPEQASGRAILAVQQASEQHLTDQNVFLNTMLENLGRIWLDMWKTYNSKDGMVIEDLKTDPMTGEETITPVEVSGKSLEELQASVRIDISPKSPFDKYAQEISLENLAKSQFFFNTQWLEDYHSLLDQDSVMPKSKIKELIDKRKEEQKKINEIQMRGRYLQGQINNLMNSGQIMPKEMQQYMQQGQSQ